MILSLFVSGEPAPQPRARITTIGGFARAYTPKGPVQPWRAAISRAVRAIEPWKAPRGPVREPVAVRLGFYLSRPKSHYTRSQALTRAAASHPTGPRADADNLAKAVLDELTQLGVWADDGQVVDLSVSKRYADGCPAGVQIEVWDAADPLPLAPQDSSNATP